MPSPLVAGGDGAGDWDAVGVLAGPVKGACEGDAVGVTPGSANGACGGEAVGVKAGSANGACAWGDGGVTARSGEGAVVPLPPAAAGDDTRDWDAARVTARWGTGR